MTRPIRPGEKPPIGKNIETSEDEFLSLSPSSPPSTPPSSPLLTPCPPRKDIEKKSGNKRSYIPSPSSKKRNQNLKRQTLIPKPTTARIPTSTLSPKYHLQRALENLNQAYIGLKEEENKEEVRLLGDYVQSILVGENPFIKERERKERDVLKGLVEEVKALRKEVAPRAPKSYAEKLKQGLSSSTSAPPPPPPPSSFPSTSTADSSKPTSTRGKKKQLQERRLVLVIDQKDQPLDIFSIRNRVN